MASTSIRAGFGIYYDHFGEGIINTFDANGAYGLSSRVNSPIDLTTDQAPRFASVNAVPTQIIPTVHRRPRFRSRPPISNPCHGASTTVLRRRTRR